MTIPRTRNQNIDLIKGLLIVLVILGHVLQGSTSDSIWRSLIYSFHMPLFIGVSGYLFNAYHIKITELLKNYSIRIVIPWAIAIVGYFVLVKVNIGGVNFFSGILGAFATPYYHLWFIPAFLSWVLVTWVLKKLITLDRIILAIGLIISVIAIGIKYYTGIHNGGGPFGPQLASALNTLRPHFYFFFVAGYALKQISLKRPKAIEYIAVFIGFMCSVYLFFHHNRELFILNFFLFNTLLLNLSLKLAFHEQLPRNKLLEWIGVNSLALYLWHVLPILIGTYLIGKENLLVFYATVLTLEVAFMLAYNYLLRVSFLRKYAFGRGGRI